MHDPSFFFSWWQKQPVYSETFSFREELAGVLNVTKEKVSLESGIMDFFNFSSAQTKHRSLEI